MLFAWCHELGKCSEKTFNSCFCHLNKLTGNDGWKLIKLIKLLLIRKLAYSFLTSYTRLLISRPKSWKILNKLQLIDCSGVFGTYHDVELLVILLIKGCIHKKTPYLVYFLLKLINFLKFDTIAKGAVNLARKCVVVCVRRWWKKSTSQKNENFVKIYVKIQWWHS